MYRETRDLSTPEYLYSFSFGSLSCRMYTMFADDRNNQSRGDGLGDVLGFMSRSIAFLFFASRQAQIIIGI